MNLSIIIVSWKVKEQLKRNLQAIFSSEGMFHRPGMVGFTYQVFVVDNDSKDGTVEMIKKEFPQVKVVANKNNLGFATAVNQVMIEAEGEYVLLLNPDMKVRSDTLSKMIKWMNNNPASVSSCKLINKQGQTVKHIRNFPTWKDQLAIILKLPHLFPSILNKYLRSDFDYNSICKVDSVRGSFLMIRSSTIKEIGLLDERYFIWFEDVDYCKTIVNNNLDIWYVGDIECFDYVGQSFKQVKILTTQKYFKDSMLKYFKKWHPAWQFSLLQIAWIFGIFLSVILSFLGFKSRAKT
jgi:GT2 family glycosyltransferase